MAPSTLFSFSSALAVVALAASANAAATVNTPTGLVTCQPSALTWTSGTAPFFLSVLPGGQASATALETFPETSAQSITWTVDLAAGTSITLALKDSTGNIVYSDVATIQAGTDTSCVGKAAGSASSATSAAAGGMTTTMVSTTTTGKVAGATAAGGSAVSSVTSAAAAAATKATGAGVKNGAIGFSGLAVAAAVFLA